MKYSKPGTGNAWETPLDWSLANQRPLCRQGSGQFLVFPDLQAAAAVSPPLASPGAILAAEIRGSQAQ